MNWTTLYQWRAAAPIEEFNKILLSIITSTICSVECNVLTLQPTFVRLYSNVLPPIHLVLITCIVYNNKLQRCRQLTATIWYVWRRLCAQHFTKNISTRCRWTDKRRVRKQSIVSNGLYIRNSCTGHTVCNVRRFFDSTFYRRVTAPFVSVSYI